MTDKERFLELFNSWGINPENHPEDNDTNCFYIFSHDNEEKIDGYAGFLTTFEFDDEGTFIRMGIWE